MTKNQYDTQTHSWVDNLAHAHSSSTHTFLNSICESFNSFPFMRHNKLVTQVNESGKVECVTEMSQHLVGNVLYGILHGGVTASMLDSIGGLQTMVDLSTKIQQEHNPDDSAVNTDIFKEKIKEKVGKVATTDFRVDYLNAGRGKRFTATAKVIRLGSRHSTCQMQLVNEEGTLIAIATGSYAY